MTGRTRRVDGRVGFAAALAVGLLVLGWAAGRPPREGEPLDPRSSGELGARGLVLFLEEMGADVRVSREAPTDGSDVVVVLRDRLNEATRDDLVAWVRAGGTLVIADPSSPLSAPLAQDPGDVLGLLEGDLSRGTCDLEALRGVEDVDAPGAVLHAVPPGGASCFGDGDAAFVVAAPAGAGTVVSIGSPTPFLNDDLDERDHAVLVGSLAAPRPGTRVTIIEDPAPGEGDESLGDLVGDGVRAALVQLALAFLVYALFRARRLGRPVAEPLPVRIAGSELVVAVGRLLQEAGDPGRAAAVLQEDTRSSLAQGLGTAADASPEVVADAAAGRGGVDATRVREVLTRGPVDDEQALVDLARDLDAVREEILHVRSR